MIHLTALIILWFNLRLSAAALILYDGVSTVNLTGQPDWSLKYPLGTVCEDPTWQKILTIDIIAATPDQADLVMAFGTSSEYFAVALAYDGKMGVPIGACNCGTVRRFPMFVTPPDQSALRVANPTLEAQYATGLDFRHSLINNEDQTANWQPYGLDYDVTGTIDDIGNNFSPLRLHITGERDLDKTILNITKNGRSEQITMTSTWLNNDEVFLFMGVDGIHDEIFELSGISEEEVCAPTASPTDAPTVSPTAAPTDIPTDAPTDLPTDAPTDDPTKSPTDAPTDLPTDAPTDKPTISPTAAPTNAPTDAPTNEPTKSPTDMPSDLPTKTPNDSPTDAPTNLPSELPTDAPSDAPTELPTFSPTGVPSDTPTLIPTNSPTELPTDAPTRTPTETPTVGPSDAPSRIPTFVPAKLPTMLPTQNPSRAPFPGPTLHPSSSTTSVATTNSLSDDDQGENQNEQQNGDGNDDDSAGREVSEAPREGDGEVSEKENEDSAWWIILLILGLSCIVCTVGLYVIHRVRKLKRQQKILAIAMSIRTPGSPTSAVSMSSVVDTAL